MACQRKDSFVWGSRPPRSAFSRRHPARRRRIVSKASAQMCKVATHALAAPPQRHLHVGFLATPQRSFTSAPLAPASWRVTATVTAACALFYFAAHARRHSTRQVHRNALVTGCVRNCLRKGAAMRCDVHLQKNRFRRRPRYRHAPYGVRTNASTGTFLAWALRSLKTIHLARSYPPTALPAASRKIAAPPHSCPYQGKPSPR